MAPALGQDEDASITPADKAQAVSRANTFIGSGLSDPQVLIVGENYATVSYAEDHCDHKRGLWFRMLAAMVGDANGTKFFEGIAIGRAKLADLENTKSQIQICESFWGFYGKGSKQLFDGALE